MVLEVIIIIIVVVLVLGVGVYLSRFRKCPSDKILVIYGRVGKGSEGGTKAALTIHGGAKFIWPVIQDYKYMDLTPMSIEVALTNALSKQNIRVDVPSRFTVAISTEPSVMNNAAERLLGLNHDSIIELARDILFGQLRLVIATMDIEEINSDRDKFLANVSKNVEQELSKIGLKLINVNVTDIRDESSYIEALGKEAAAKAINDARRTVAEQNRDGAIGEANAQRDERINVSKANSNAVTGENLAKVTIADSDAIRREKEAEALRRATAAEKVQAANSLRDAYEAEKLAEIERAEKERATREADELVKAKIEKQKAVIAAEAEADKVRLEAKSQADAIFYKMKAQADGINEVLTKQAAGFEKLVKAAGGDANQAISLMIADKLEDIVTAQVEAIKGIKIDKVTVWDTGSSEGGTPTTANFLSGMIKSLPPLENVFEMAGMNLPNILQGKDKVVKEVPAPKKEKK